MPDFQKSPRVLFLVLASVSLLLAIISASLPNWTHLSAGALDLPDIVNVGPWRVCIKPKGAPNHCTALDSSFKADIEPNGVVFLTFTLSNKQWSEVLAVRAFQVIGMLVAAAGIVAIILTRFMHNLSATLESLCYKGFYVVAFCGFLVTCIWADFANNDGFRHGASYICWTVSWMVALAAALMGTWSQGGGVPPVVAKHAVPVTAFLVLVLAIIATSLNDWGHGESAHVIGGIPFFISDTTYSLWKLCTSDAGILIHQNGHCFKYASSVFVPYHNQTQTTFAKTITFSSGELSKIHGCQAMSILMVLCAAACFISLMYGQFANNMTHMFVRLRTVFAGLTAFFSFVLMCVFAAFMNGRSAPDLGSAFAINCVVWVLALLWAVNVARGGADHSSGGGGYVVTGGDKGPSPYQSV